MSSFFTWLLGLLWQSRRDRQKLQFEALAEMAALCSEYEAGLIRLQEARCNDEGVENSADSRLRLADLSNLDAKAQRLQLQFRHGFPEKDVTRAYWELMRRMVQTKQFLMFTAQPSESFAEALSWIAYQSRETMRISSKVAGLDLVQDRPFIMGFHSLEENTYTSKYADSKEPWADAEYRKSLREAKRLWEEAGHHWNGPDPETAVSPHTE